MTIIDQNERAGSQLCDHDEERVDAGFSNTSCWMGEGHRLHILRCRKCGRERGPFLPEGVGEGY